MCDDDDDDDAAAPSKFFFKSRKIDRALDGKYSFRANG